jgi:hypothetical protein
MATTEDIISMVIIIMVLLVGSLLFVRTYGKTIMDKERYMVQYELEDNYGATFNTLLELTESSTKRSFGDLLGSAVYYRTDTVVTPAGQLKIDEQFETLLGMMYPRDNYYLEIDPVIKGIELMFIMDGSNSTKDESEYLARHMDEILADIESAEELQSADISAEVIILHNASSGWCANHTRCSYLSWMDIYFNKSYDVFDMTKHQYGLFKPYHFDEEEEVWRSDWETAMASLALRMDNSDLRTLKVFMPITDSLPGSTRYLYPCPRDYAFSILARDQEILMEKNFVVDPILSANVDPVLYCDSAVIDQMEALAQVTNGVVIRSRENFAPRVKTTLLSNINKIRIQIGKPRSGEQYVAERKLPMPNGKFALARLHIYPY